MSDSSFITMLVVLGLVWGGFATLLVHAFRRERYKQGNGPAPGDHEQ